MNDLETNGYWQICMDCGNAWKHLDDYCPDCGSGDTDEGHLFDQCDCEECKINQASYNSHKEEK